MKNDKMFDGVTSYLSGTATIRIYLPSQKPVCQYCWHCGFETNLDRAYCRLTDEFIINPSKIRGEQCPIVFDEEKEKKE
jgi:hypothetical protein